MVVLRLVNKEGLVADITREMIFSIQRYLEDYFHRRNLEDMDQYAVSLANLYDRERRGMKEDEFLRSVRRLRTVFFKKNSHVDRGRFERNLLGALDRRFKKKISTRAHESFPRGLSTERRQFRTLRRITISQLLASYKHSVESRTIDAFWLSRKAGRLRSRPEIIGQDLLALFAVGVLQDRGLVLKELFSGVGFVDVAIIISQVAHIIELKILKATMKGAGQLQQYMRNEKRKVGWLILFDARPMSRKNTIPSQIGTPVGIIRTIVIDINPVIPSRADF